MAYTTRSISNLKDQVNIVDVVSRSMTLKRAGSSYKGICPFHNEKTPSFNVNEQRQMFYCFGCQASGDVIEFVSRFNNLDFNDAVERLASEYGITMEETRGRGIDLEKYYAINKDAANYFYKNFTEKANKGYSYMKARKIAPQYLKKFGIGYAEDDWTSLYDYLKDKGHEDKDIMELGLISKGTQDKGKYYDKFRNRVIFPIINTRGKVIGFGGRAISPEDNPKYLNSQESQVFQKKNNLYGLNLSRTEVNKLGYIILVEGYMDVISLYQAGIQNVAASLGTALTESQAKLIKRYAKKVVLCYDTDVAGQAATMRGMEILKNQGLDVRIMKVTDGKDPDEFIKDHGKEEFLKLVENAEYYGDYKISSSIAGFDLEDHQDRIRAIQTIGRILKSMTPAEREEYASAYSKKLNISKSVLIQEAMNDNPVEQIARVPSDQGKDRSVDKEEITAIESELILLAYKNEEYIEKIQSNNLLTTDISKRILDIISQNIREDGIVDTAKVLDQMDDEDRDVMYNILENTVISQDEERIFNDIVRRHQLNILQEEVERVNELLRYANEGDAESEKIEDLMKRSMELQKEIAKLKAEEN